MGGYRGGGGGGGGGGGRGQGGQASPFGGGIRIFCCLHMQACQVSHAPILPSLFVIIIMKCDWRSHSKLIGVEKAINQMATNTAKVALVNFTRGCGSLGPSLLRNSVSAVHVL